jgi:hypothetical protein
MINLYIIFANIKFTKILILELSNSFIAPNKKVFFGSIFLFKMTIFLKYLSNNFLILTFLLT